MFRVSLRLLLLFIIVLVMSVSSAVIAQDDSRLTEGEQALLERVMQARAAMADYESFVFESNHTEYVSIESGAGLLWDSYEKTMNLTMVTNMQFIRGETPNIQVSETLEATLSESKLDKGASVPTSNSQQIAYSFEAISVDNTIYYRGEGGLPGETFPEEWTVVENVGSWKYLEKLDNPVDGSRWVLLDDENNIVLENLSSIELTNDTLADGTEVDVITLQSDKYRNPSDIPVSSEGTTITIYLDENDHILYYASEEELNTLNNGTIGATIVRDSMTFSNINTVSEAAMAPIEDTQ